MAIFPLALPISGSSKAADTTTTTTNTTSALVGALTNNANINGENAADSSFDDLFGGDFDFSHSDQLGEDSPAAAATNASDFGEHEDPFAGQSASHPTNPARRAEPPHWNDNAPAMFANGITPVPTNAESAPVAPLLGLQLVLPPVGHRELQDPERVVPANDALMDNAPANGAPAKRGRGRPPGKAPPKAPVHYRCRYGCVLKAGMFKNDRALRKHMSRVHSLFSAAHTELEKCGGCGRTIDRRINELACVKRNFQCKKLTDSELADISVIAPRDAQEEADTFAYTHSGPSRLVIVHDGDDEDEFSEMNAQAISSWRAGGLANPAQSIHGLMTPGETPSPPNGQAVVDLTGDDEDVPATSFPAYEGKGKGRAMDYPEIPSLPKKRAGDFPSEGEPVAKRTMRKVSYNETEAFAVPARRRRRSTVLVADLLAEHEADFPEGDYVDPAGTGSSAGATFGFDALVMPDAIESGANANPNGVEPSTSVPFGYDAFALQGAIESDANGFDFDFTL
jgi:hypothetical protein